MKKRVCIFFSFTVHYSWLTILLAMLLLIWVHYCASTSCLPMENPSPHDVGQVSGLPTKCSRAKLPISHRKHAGRGKISTKQMAGRAKSLIMQFGVCVTTQMHMLMSICLDMHASWPLSLSDKIFKCRFPCSIPRKGRKQKKSQWKPAFNIKQRNQTKIYSLNSPIILTELFN